MNFTVHDFANKFNMIKKKYICKNHNGLNISPKISWNWNPETQVVGFQPSDMQLTSPAPGFIKNTKSYALILEDPDAPSGNFIHWYIPYISPEINQIDSLNNNSKKNNFTKGRIIQCKNSLGEIGYHGPCAPSGVHRYIFTLYALDGAFNIPSFPVNSCEESIKSSKEFENKLKIKKINILEKKSLIYKYGP